MILLIPVIGKDSVCYGKRDSQQRSDALEYIYMYIFQFSYATAANAYRRLQYES